ncbi:hypothetical protein O6H91_20G057800 [Diphasiastrum complanatum]|uniref:Uncharacterized protein n=4 Tax=Diphasiastrum complanatum TaxID=34168 RepID=A0ACC2AQT1_DIPCM|nr:hypothetical protein O6H91_20G057800 [Diphasiastrum complanatum]KAJ7519838.1 hypothetical protein O6H91_20G057800 [Diphasiastrum complanatum]KAJ7519839.1 hypothetical protein O6H91_20G057800 [Diphasiastrum complanatum]KAJ7519841.1 hypothetical protein O6H91_20G057800 [Diphasiastrum complanatum]
MTKRTTKTKAAGDGDTAIKSKQREKAKPRAKPKAKAKEREIGSSHGDDDDAAAFAIEAGAGAAAGAGGRGDGRWSGSEKSSVGRELVPQAVALAAAPIFPNSIKWSDENLIAVAAGHTVTILSPSTLSGPRGFISISPSSLFDIGRVEHADLEASVLLPFTLQRDNRVNVRCVDWSPAGAASNGGCLLAVCTTDHRVKLYRAPCREYQSEWIEVTDLSTDMHEFCVQSNFMEMEQPTFIIPSKLGSCMEVKNYLRGRKNSLPIEMQKFKHRKKTKDFTSNFSTFENNVLMDEHSQKIQSFASPEPIITISKRWLGLSEGVPAEVLKEDAGSRYWARGFLVKLMEEKALVHYEASISDEVKEEWVPLFVDSCAFTSTRAVDDHIDLDSLLTSGCETNLKLSFRPGVRPLLETEDDEETVKVLAVGDLVEAWMNERWQEGFLLEIDDTSKIVDFSGCLGQVILDTSNLRPAPEWNGEKWLYFKAESGTNCTRSLMGAIPRVNGIKCLTEECRSEKIEAGSAADMPRYLTDTSVTAIAGLKSEVSRLKPYIQIDPHSFKVQNPKEIKQPQNISTAQYVARSYVLAAIVLSWSPRCRVVCADYVESSNQFREYIFLAVGTKSGRVAFWRFQSPQAYSVEEVLPPKEMTFIGFWCAHESWVTAVDWATSQSHAFFDVGLPQESILLATGSYDGSVKLWSAPLLTLIGVPSNSHALPWILLKQVLHVDSVPVTTLALKLQFQTPKCILLAVGKGSGGVTACDIDFINANSRIACQPRAHEQLVTGVCWTSDGGHCLYSCGQDNSLQGWKFDGNQLVPLSSPDCSNLLASAAQNTTSDIPFSAVDSFYGVALSQCSFSLAVVRGIASEATDQMYQSRSQKGVVQVIWVEGEQQRDTQGSLIEQTTMNMPTNVLQNLERKITSSLKLLEAHRQFLVLWDVLTQFSYSKNCTCASFFELVLSNWLGNLAAAASFEWSSKNLKSILPKASCRQLQILVILYRRLLLPNIKADVLSAYSSKATGSPVLSDFSSPILSGFDQFKSELTLQEQFWLEQFWHIEHELRQRLFFLTLASFLCQISAHKTSTKLHASFESDTHASLSKLHAALRMSNWVLTNSSQNFEELVEEAKQVQKCSIASPTSSVEPFYEECTLCDQPVKFESLEVANCTGLDSSPSKLRHRLQRCAVSLQVCPLRPQWCCSCCARCVTQPAPTIYFALKSRMHIKELSPTFLLSQKKEPLCPFCGILMYRLLPEFLLTPSLV